MRRLGGHVFFFPDQRSTCAVVARYVAFGTGQTRRSSFITLDPSLFAVQATMTRLDVASPGYRGHDLVALLGNWKSPRLTRAQGCLFPHMAWLVNCRSDAVVSGDAATEEETVARPKSRATKAFRQGYRYD